jgi:hypothetical protein
MLDTDLLPPVNTPSARAGTLLAPWWPEREDDEPCGPLAAERPPRLTLALANDEQTDVCQQLVTAQHYLHAPVDPRCNVLAYIVLLGRHRIGCLIFGRPEATRVGGWYGDPEEKLAGHCRLSRWEILNLARIYIAPIAQEGGAWCRPGLVPGFFDRSGCWHSCLTTTVIRMAIECVLVDYLVCFAPVFLDQPYAIAEVLSYCDQTQPGHRGVIYQSAGFRLQRTNVRGLQTYAIPVRPLTQGEDAYIRYVATYSLRSRRLRAQVAAERVAQQVALF